LCVEVFHCCVLTDQRSGRTAHCVERVNDLGPSLFEHLGFVGLRSWLRVGLQRLGFFSGKVLLLRLLLRLCRGRWLLWCRFLAFWLCARYLGRGVWLP
jgi:hypothetical protein